MPSDQHRFTRLARMSISPRHQSMLSSNPRQEVLDLLSHPRLSGRTEFRQALPSSTFRRSNAFMDFDCCQLCATGFR
jgi:hypothetical protein